MENNLMIGDYQSRDYSLDDAMPNIIGFETPLNIWNRARGSRKMPVWNDFHFEDWVGWHSNLCITELLANPFRQKERIMGEVYRDYFGKLSEPFVDQKVYDSKEYSPAFLKEFEDYMERQYQSPFICMFEGIIPKKSAAFKKIKMVDLPITDDEGKRAVFLLSFLLAT